MIYEIFRKIEKSYKLWKEGVDAWNKQKEKFGIPMNDDGMRRIWYLYEIDIQKPKSCIAIRQLTKYDTQDI
jgi:hypothetical protein